jgi:putative nucleotidyltransferase with HDIG domain
MNLDLRIEEKDLPMLSVVATQAMDLLRKPTVTNNELNELIRQDPALTSRILRIANSPFYSGRFQSRKISEAIVRMGLRQLRNILVVAATGELFDSEDPHIRSIYDHALAVAMVSDHLAKALSLPDAEEVFIAGLLHDIGKFIIYRQHPLPYGELIDESARTNTRLLELEDARFQYFSHVSVGGIAVRKWKLSEPIAEATRYHHQVESEIAKEIENKNLVCVVALANVLVNNLSRGLAVCEPGRVAEMAFTRQLGLNDQKLAKVSASAVKLCELSQQDMTEPQAETA